MWSHGNQLAYSHVLGQKIDRQVGSKAAPGQDSDGSGLEIELTVDTPQSGTLYSYSV